MPSLHLIRPITRDYLEAQCSTTHILDYVFCDRKTIAKSFWCLCSFDSLHCTAIWGEGQGRLLIAFQCKTHLLRARRVMPSDQMAVPLGSFLPLHNGGPKEIVCLPIVWWPLYMLRSLIHIKSHLSDSALVNNWESLLSHSVPLSYWDQIKFENPVHDRGGETTFWECRLGELSWVLLWMNEWMNEKRREKNNIYIQYIYIYIYIYIYSIYIYIGEGERKRQIILSTTVH